MKGTQNVKNNHRISNTSNRYRRSYLGNPTTKMDGLKT
jgi:hypothetical protein